MKRIIKIGIIAVIAMFVLVMGINYYVILSTKGRIINDFKDKDIDCILVLGASTWNGSPSPMLKDRLDEGIKLYKEGVANKIVMSGDHGKDNYDEVNTMRDYAIESGVPEEDIFMDHAGFSTYDSIYRIKDIFGAKNIVVVTQKYHLYRALYIAKRLGVNAYGSSSDPRRYSGQLMRDLREILARDKDFVKSIFKPKSKILGDKIDLTGSGLVTVDK